ncbi:hypothetical protein BDW22DRAFT_473288 [Trametopsis cervina]|nr:hypothetical protein BDW22DRAFT_473288 [Trametopsis cervina]
MGALSIGDLHAASSRGLTNRNNCLSTALSRVGTFERLAGASVGGHFNPATNIAGVENKTCPLPLTETWRRHATW